MMRWRSVLALPVLALAAGVLAAAEPPPLLSAHGTVEKVGKDTLTIRPRLPDGKFGRGLALRVTGTSKVATLMPRREKLSVVLEGRGLTPDQTWELEMAGGGSERCEIAVQLGDKVAAGRHVFALRVMTAGAPDGTDAFLVIDVSR